MTGYAMLLLPSANRVYAAGVDVLAAAELACVAPAIDPDTLRTEEIAGVRYVCFDASDPEATAPIGAHSAAYALFERLPGTGLQPVRLARPDRFDDDLVSIPKYSGKTNQQFTRLMVNVTTAAIRDSSGRPLTVLDPMCGRGTTLSTAWTLGQHAAGVEADAKAVELYAAFLRTYLRRKRLKHTLDTTPVRRDGRSLGRRLDATVRPDPDAPRDSDAQLTLSIMPGDTRQSAALWGKRRFDAVVCDTPYGVVHGSATGEPGRRDRSPADLLAEAVPVWLSQLRPGGALGLAWNTLGLSRDQLAAMVTQAGAEVLDEGPWRQFGHRVDSSIHRDLLVAVRP